MFTISSQNIWYIRMANRYVGEKSTKPSGYYKLAIISGLKLIRSHIANGHGVQLSTSSC